MVGEKPIREKEEKEDIEELRQVFGAITEFMYQVKDLVKEFMETLSSGFNGEKLGREIAQMYKSLVEAGMPPEKAYELTQRFLEAKLEAIPKVSALLDMLKKPMAGPGAAKPQMPQILVAGSGKPKIIRLEKKEEGGFDIKVEGEEEEEKEGKEKNEE